jgi:MFS family permease
MGLRVSVILLVFTYWCVDIVSPALPAIQQSLAISATGAGLVFSLFFAGRLFANLPAAWLAERKGPRVTAVAGAAVLLAGSLLAAKSSSLEALLPARGIQGAGVAILATAGLLSVLRALPAGGAAMTAFNASTGVGSAVGLLVGGVLTAGFGWRSVFWMISLNALVLLIASLIARPQPSTARPTHSAAESALPVAATSTVAQAVAVGANLLVFVNYAIWVVLLPLLGATKFGFNPEQVGLLLLFVNLVHLGSALPVGRVIRVAGAARALAAGLGIAGIGMLLAPLAPNVAWLAGPMILYAVGQLAGNSAAGDLILRLGGSGGRAVGAVRLSSDIGLVVGPAAAGVLADAAGVEAPFYVLGLLSVAVALIAIAARFGQRSRGRARR